MNIKQIIFSILLFSGIQAMAQKATIKLDSLAARSNLVSEARPIEKVYVQFDKPYYAVGDTMFFKAYLTIGLHELSALSRIVYIDMISSRDSLVKSFMLPVANGTASGTIVLSSPKFKQDSYRIKAYTKWMMNFDQAYFFNKTISIGNSLPSEVNTLISLKRTVDNKIPKISAEVTFMNADGEPYKGKKVEWGAAKGFEYIADGKGTTDSRGMITLSFLNNKPSDLTNAVLTTTLDVGGKKTYDSLFPLKTVAGAPDVQFFPEGGNMINSLPSKVAVKAVQTNGLGIGFKGTITDNIGNTLTSFSSQHAGMGWFVLTPDIARVYKVNIDFDDGTKGTYDLPKVQASGLTFTVNNNDTSRVVVRVMADSTYLKAHTGNTYYILGRNGSVICYAVSIPALKASVFNAVIPTSKFPTGIAQITLMSSDGTPVAERIVFIRHEDQLNVTINTDKKTYGPRQKVSLNVVSAANNKPIESNLSISVIDETKMPVDENAETTILSSILLSSDLKGYIEKPNYYFNKVNTKAAADLDLLMLTQGYRRFTYQQMLSNTIESVVYFPQQSIEIAGTLRTINGMPFKGGSVTLQIPDRYFSMAAVSDAEGKFKFSKLVFTDSTRIIVHAKNNVNAKNLMLTMDGDAFPSIDKNPDFPDEKLNIDTMMHTYLESVRKLYNNENTLKTVNITAKAKVNQPSFRDVQALQGLNAINASTIAGDQLQGCNDVMSCIRMLARGVTFDQNTNMFYVTRDYTNGRRIPMAIFVKKMNVETAALNSINPADIVSVDVFLRDDLGLVNNVYQTNGVINVNLKEAAPAPAGTKISMDDLKNLMPQANVVKLTPQGYTIAKEFYSPKYLTANAMTGPDLRSTIYWDPALMRDETGKAAVEFYTADEKGTYRAVVEGIDKDGRLGYSVYRFKVE